MASITPPSGPSRSTPAIERVAAQSSWIASFEYDAANETLTTFLKSGAIYQHKEVDPAEWIDLQTAKSHSKNWADRIRGKKPSVSVKSAKSPNSEIKLG